MYSKEPVILLLVKLNGTEHLMSLVDTNKYEARFLESFLFCFCCHNLFLNILLTTFNTVHNLLTIYKIPIIKMFNTHLGTNYSNVILTRQQTNF